MPFVDKFVVWGSRVFTSDGWHRVAFQPILYFFLWGATVRIACTDALPIRIKEVFNPGTEVAWMGLGLVCPPLALLSWWLIRRCMWSKAALAGLWVRLGADMGQLSALLIYHIVVVLTEMSPGGEARIYARYVVGASLVFAAFLVVRDVWALVMTERLAGHIRRSEECEEVGDA